MTGLDGFAIGVDLGTSNTVAVVRWPDGRTRPLLFDGAPVMPSAVCLDDSGRLQVGRDALRLAALDPARLELNPKRRVDEAVVLLGGYEVPVVDLLGAILAAVARAAVEAVGFLPPAALTYPASWGAQRREVLAGAAVRAGWPPVRFVPEPVAAARYFADVLRRPVPVGESLGVFDFGGGTLDIAVVRNSGTGFEVLGDGGLRDLGGLDVDAELVAHLGRHLEKTASLNWSKLDRPESVTASRDRRLFWEDVRGAKEMLSRTPIAPVAVPGMDDAVHLTREELERIVTPLVGRAVRETAAVIRRCGLRPDQLVGLFLVGGSSRLPIVARLLHSELGIAPTVLEQPELPVAEGALAELVPPMGLAAAGPGGPVSAPPAAVSASPSMTGTFPAGLPTGALPTGALPASFATGALPTGTFPAGYPAANDYPAGYPATGALPASPQPTGALPTSTPPTGPFPTGTLPTGTLPAGFATGALPTGQPPNTPSAAVPPPPTESFMVPTPSGTFAGWTHPGTAAPEPGWTHPGSPAASPGQTGRIPAQRSADSSGLLDLAAPPARIGQPPWYRRPRPLLAAAVALLLVVAGMVAVGLLANRGDDHEVRFADTLDTVGGPIMMVGDGDSPADPSATFTALAGKTAYLGYADRAGMHLIVHPLDQGADRRVELANDGQASSVEWRAMVVRDDAVLCYAYEYGEDLPIHLYALDPANGKAKWDKRFDSNDRVASVGPVLVWTDPGHNRIVGLDPTSGTEKWSTPDPQADTSYLSTGIRSAYLPADLNRPVTLADNAPLVLAGSHLVQTVSDKSSRVIDVTNGHTVDGKGIADNTDYVFGSGDTIFVVNDSAGYQVFAHSLKDPGSDGQTKRLYTAQDAARPLDVAPCGAGVCVLERSNSDDDTSTVRMIGGTGQHWSQLVAGAKSVLSVGDGVLVQGAKDGDFVKFLDGKGDEVALGSAGVGAIGVRVNGGTALLLKGSITTYPNDVAVTGLGARTGKVKSIGVLDGVRASACSWNEEIIVCPQQAQFQIWRFAA